MSDRIALIARLGAAIATATGETQALLNEALTALVADHHLVEASEARKAKDRLRKRSTESVESKEAVESADSVDVVSSPPPAGKEKGFIGSPPSAKATAPASPTAPQGEPAEKRVVRPRAVPSPFRLEPYIAAYSERFPGATVPTDRMGRALKTLESRHGPDETLRRWKIFLAKKGEYGVEVFARTWSDWGGEMPAAANGHVPASNGAEAAWQEVLDLLPLWQRRDPELGERQRALPEQARLGLSAIGGLRVLAETPDSKRVWTKRDFVAAYRQEPAHV